MRPGAVRVETVGSVWWFDETTHEYLRLPREEKPREKPEWSDERAGPLQDAVWHPYVRWETGKHPGYNPDGRLVEVPSRDGLLPAIVRVLDDPREGLIIWTADGDNEAIVWAPLPL